MKESRRGEGTETSKYLREKSTRERKLVVVNEKGEEANREYVSKGELYGRKQYHLLRRESGRDRERKVP